MAAPLAPFIPRKMGALDVPFSVRAFVMFVVPEANWRIAPFETVSVAIVGAPVMLVDQPFWLVPLMATVPKDWPLVANVLAPDAEEAGANVSVELAALSVRPAPERDRGEPFMPVTAQALLPKVMLCVPDPVSDQEVSDRVVTAEKSIVPVNAEVVNEAIVNPLTEESTVTAPPPELPSNTTVSPVMGGAIPVGLPPLVVAQ
jgi:hypothetical protein